MANSGTQPESAEQTGGRFGTLSGVFMPTLLTILGVIMFLREGWVIGNTGLVGGALIMTIAFAITGATALSLSSIVTNIRIGAGGAYSVISQSLGIEMGGSIGVPLYLSQVLATTMYIFGFREGWAWIFETHPPLLVDVGLLVVLFGIAFVSAGLAFKVQYVIAAVILAALVSVGIAAGTGSMQYEPQMWIGAETAQQAILTEDFWAVFAVFFPAATGIMAGANMSGELKDPRKSIPLGTLGAVGVSYVVYMLLAYWLATSATPEELQSNYTVMIDKAFWGPAVLAGLLGATFSSALSSIVGAPRILQALADHGIVPGGKFLSKTTDKGEPRNAMWVSGALILAALMLRDLNVVAPFITMFFLITYGMINLVVLTEQSLGIVSFRPKLQLPKAVPLVGALGCLFAMFIINAAISLVAVVVVVMFYALLIRRHLDSPVADVRSGLFVALAQWAAQKASDLPSVQERAWKPNLLVPVGDPLELRGTYRFVGDLVWPTGYVELMGMTTDHDEREQLEGAMREIARDFSREGVYTRWTILDTDDVALGVILGMQALQGSFFRPNIVFSAMPETEEEEKDLVRVIDAARDNDLGAIVVGIHPKTRMGSRRVVNLWLPPDAPDLELALRQSELDLAILVAYMIRQKWENSTLNIVTCVPEPEPAEGDGVEEDAAQRYAEHKREVRDEIERVIEIARLPDPEIHLLEGDFPDCLDKAPRSDLDVMGLRSSPDFDLMRKAVDKTRSTCVFVADSGQESAIA